MMDVNIEQLKALAELAKANELAEITVTDGDKSITIKTPSSVSHTVNQFSGGGGVSTFAPAMGGATTAVATESVAPAAAIPAPSAVVADAANIKTISAPMVGTFYASSSPESPVFVEKGTVVKVGQTLCILEAMKQMNQLESELAGTIVEVLGQNGQPVEFGQPLFKIQV
jgi:acetyl-CoA carboxylase biotin carboxyl carrier protein